MPYASDDPTIIVIEIADRRDMTQARLRQSVNTILAVKSKHPAAQIWLTIDGYDGDPRELFEVPEVRTFVRKMLGMFVAFGLHVKAPVGG
jgi:hypothetical protein